MSKRVHNRGKKLTKMKGPPPWTGRQQRRRAMAIGAWCLLLYVGVMLLISGLALL